MPSRNTPVLNQIIEAFGDSSPDALARLQEYFKDSLVIVAGDVQTVAAHAEKLRLRHALKLEPRMCLMALEDEDLKAV